MKRVLALVLALLTALSLCACKINLTGMHGASGRAHEELMANVRDYLDMARGQEDAGMTLFLPVLQVLPFFILPDYSAA